MSGWQPKITKDEFEAAYCQRSGISRKLYAAAKRTYPCRCEQDECEGWAAVPIGLLERDYQPGGIYFVDARSAQEEQGDG